MLHSSFSVVVTSLLSSESGNTGLSVSVTKKEKSKNSGYSVHVALHQPDYQIIIVRGKQLNRIQYIPYISNIMYQF